MKKINKSQQQAHSLSDFKHKFPHLYAQIKLGAEHIFATKKKNDALTAVQKDGLALQSYVAFQKNREVVSAAASENGFALQFAHDELKKDKDIVRIAVKQNGYALQFAHETLRQTEDIVYEAIQVSGPKEKTRSVNKRHGCALKFAAEELQNNRRIALAAVEDDGYALEFCGELRDDLEIVTAAVTQEPYALQFASNNLRKNPDFILNVMNSNSAALRYVIVTEAAFENIEFKKLIINKVSNSPNILRYLGEHAQTNKEVVDAATNKDPLAIRFAHEDLKKDREFFLKNPTAIRFAHEDLKKDREFFLRNPSEIRHAHEDLKKDKEFFWNYPSEIRFAHEDLKKDREFFLRLIKRQPLDTAMIEEEMTEEFKSFFNERQSIYRLAIYFSKEHEQKIKKLLDHIDHLFVSHTSSITDLTEVLTQTFNLMINKITPEEYKKNALIIAEQTSRPLQILGGLMLAIAVIAAGLGVAAACTGIGMVPAIALGSMSVGFFAAGLISLKKADTSDHELVGHISALATS